MIISNRVLLCLGFAAALTLGCRNSHAALVASPVPRNYNGSICPALTRPNESPSSGEVALPLLANDGGKRPVAEIYDRISQIESDVAQRSETLASNTSFIPRANFAPTANLTPPDLTNFTANTATPANLAVTCLVAFIGAGGIAFCQAQVSGQRHRH